MNDSSRISQDDPLPVGYPKSLAEVKAQTTAAHTRAVFAVNGELIALYWEIGREILGCERREGSGTEVIDRLATDLRREFPGMKGLSRSNLRYMRDFARAWSNEAMLPQAVAKLTWGHNIALLTKPEGRDARLWYATQAIENGWSRKALEAQIATGRYEREGKAHGQL